MLGNRTYFCVCEYDPTRCLKWENVHSPYMERDFFFPLNPSVLSPAALTQFDLPGALQAGLATRNSQWALFFCCCDLPCPQPSQELLLEVGDAFPELPGEGSWEQPGFSWNCASPGWDLPPQCWWHCCSLPALLAASNFGKAGMWHSTAMSCGTGGIPGVQESWEHLEVS